MPRKVDKSVEKLTLEASRQGFVFAKVNPEIQRNEGQNSTLNITYNIVEGPRTYIERIEIVGNRTARWTVSSAASCAL
jgi:outer membrane protein insertion porin family